MRTEPGMVAEGVATEWVPPSAWLLRRACWGESARRVNAPLWRLWRAMGLALGLWGEKERKRRRKKGERPSWGPTRPGWWVRRTRNKLAPCLGPSSCPGSAFGKCSEPVCTAGQCEAQSQAAIGVIGSFSDSYRPVPPNGYYRSHLCDYKFQFSSSHFFLKAVEVNFSVIFNSVYFKYYCYM